MQSDLDQQELIKQRLTKSPHLLLPALIAWLNGWYYRLKFACLGRRFKAGKLLRVYGKLNISGPGAVVFGDNCLIISDAIKPVCIRTLLPDAVVSLGQHAGLNGTSIQSACQVQIGNLSNIADAYITDTPAHSLHINRREESIEDVRRQAVIIEDNVWISVQVVILDGVRIGRNSVIGACSLVKKSVPENVFAAGNPLKIIKNLEDQS